MAYKEQTQLYIQGMVAREEQPAEIKNWFNSRIRIGKSGGGENTYADRVKEMNSSKGGTLMPDEIYCKRVWECLDRNIVSSLEKTILNHFKSLPSTPSLRWIRGDWFHDEGNIIETYIMNYMNNLNRMSDKGKIIEITPETIDKETLADQVVKQARKNKTKTSAIKRGQKVPVTYILDGAEYSVKSWRACLDTVIAELFKKEGNNFVDKVLKDEEFRGRKRLWFSEDETKLFQAGYFQPANIYYDLNLSGDTINRRCKTLASHFGYNFSATIDGKENDTRTD